MSQNREQLSIVLPRFVHARRASEWIRATRSHALTRLRVVLVLFWSAILSVAPAWSQQIPVPDEAAQNEALKLVNEVYKPDYDEAKTDEQKVALARKMLQEGAAMKNDPAGHYVSLRIARDLAGKAGDVQLALQAIAEMQKVYQIDALKMKAAVIADAAKVLRAAEEQQRIITPISALIGEAIARDDYELAKTLSEISIASARKVKDVAVIKQFARRNEEVAGIAAVYAESLAARKLLASKPTDPSANVTVGKFFCFVKGDWVIGIPMLALSNDDQLKPLAIQELDSPAEPLALGEAWWELAEQQEEFAALRIRLHAVHWYKKAVPSLSGLSKAKIEKRIGEPDANGLLIAGREVDRYKLYASNRVPSTGRGPIKVESRWLGNWQLRGDELVQDNVGNAFLLFGDINWTDYDLQVEMMTLPGSGNGHGTSVAFRARSSTTCYLLVISNERGPVIALQRHTNGRGSTRGNRALDGGDLQERWFTVRIEVRNAAFRCFVDGQEIFSGTDDTFLHGLVGLQTWGSRAKWRNLTVTAPDGALLWEGFPDVSKL